jgi:phospholipid/cholesterol/gamma-HCH transport system permease protein
MPVIQALAATGRFGFGLLTTLGRMGQFGLKTLSWMVSQRPILAEVLEQSVRIGVNTVGIMSCILFFVGANVALVGESSFKQFGGQDLLGIYVGLTCIIGMAPLIVGAMLACKPGTEITATIASMRVKEQIDALEVMAVNPYWFLVVPRFLAYLLVTPALVVFAYFSSVAGGYMAAVLQIGHNPGTFMADVLRFLSVQDIINGMVRAEVFAVVICLTSCFYGYHSAPGPAGVSRAINLAVVVGCTTIIVINYFLTEIMY